MTNVKYSAHKKTPKYNGYSELWETRVKLVFVSYER